MRIAEVMRLMNLFQRNEWEKHERRLWDIAVLGKRYIDPGFRMISYSSSRITELKKKGSNGPCDKTATQGFIPTRDGGKTSLKGQFR